MDIASRHHLFVVEDACQSIGGEIEGKKLGTFGNAGAFSFSQQRTWERMVTVGWWLLMMTSWLSV